MGLLRGLWGLSWTDGSARLLKIWPDPPGSGWPAVKNGLLRDQRVLVLEDEPIIAMLLAELIEAAGGEAECVFALATAETAIARHRPDLAVLDINIHGHTSFDLARQLHGLAVPFIFASGYGRKVVPADMEQVPAVTKPYGLDELDRAFKAAIALKAR